MAVAPWVVSDELWKRIEPLLPKVERRFRYPGRKRLPDRQALQGILFVLYTGIAWRHLPAELGFGGGSTCHRRMDEWQRAGVWERLHELLLAELRAAGEIEWSRAVADSSHVQAKKGAPKRARVRLIEPDRLQAAPSRRRHRDPARLDAHRRQPQRRHPTRPARRTRPACARQGRPTAQAARPCHRRPRLRPRQVPARATPARDRLRDRPPPDRTRLWPRACPLGRRAHLRLAAPLQATARPLRPPPRDARGIPRPRLLPHLLQEAAAVILRRVLSREKAEAL